MILILGSGGMLGGQLQKVFGNEAVGWDRQEADVTQYADLQIKIKNLKPSAIINCVAYNDVDGAENNREIAFELNTEFPGELAKIAVSLNISLVHFSTNYVFDGQKGEYAENDEPAPLSTYAESKYKGEREVQKFGKNFYIVRTAVIFGPKGSSELSKKSFVELMLGLSLKESSIKAVADEINSLTYAVDLAAQVKLLLSQKYTPGIYHITNSGQASWYDFAKEIFAVTGKNITLTPVSSLEFPRAAKRPAKSVLINTKLPQLRSWQEALKDFLTSQQSIF